MSSSAATQRPQAGTTSNSHQGANGIRDYYLHKIQEAEQKIVDKTQNLRRLEAQRNSLNTRGKSHTLYIGKHLWNAIY